MDILDPNQPLELNDPSWKIYARTRAFPPHFISSDAVVKTSLISEGCLVEGKVTDSVLFSGAVVEKGAVVEDSVIMPGSKIKACSVVQYAIIAENAVVEENATVGKRPEDCADKDKWGVATIGPEYRVPANTVVEPQEMLGV